MEIGNFIDRDIKLPKVNLANSQYESDINENNKSIVLQNKKQ